MRNIAIALVIIFVSFGCTVKQQNVHSATAINKNSERAKLYRKMASNIIAHKDYKNIPEALRYLDKSNALIPNNSETAYLKGISYMIEGKLDAAFKWLQKSIDINKQYTPARNALGIWYAKNKQWNEAIIQFSLAINLSKYSYPIVSYYNRAIAYEKTGRYRSAIKDLKSAITLGKYDRNKLFHLAKDYFIIGEFEKSIQTLRVIKNRSKFYDFETLLYAKDLFYLKRYKKSEIYLKKLLKSKDSLIRTQVLLYLRLIKKNG